MPRMLSGGVECSGACLSGLAGPAAHNSRVCGLPMVFSFSFLTVSCCLESRIL